MPDAGVPLAYWLTWAAMCAGLSLYVVGALRRRRRAASRQLARLAASERMAKAAHEALLQDVQSLVLQLQVAADCLHERAGPGAQQMESVLDAADRLLARGRMQEMGRAWSLNFQGELEQMFAELAAALAEGGPARFTLLVSGAGAEPGPAQREAIYRIGRDALLNAFGHARASKVELELSYASNRLSLHVRDDGIGFDDGAAGLAAFPRRGGLTRMRERAGALRAGLRIWSGPGLGTEVVLAVPRHFLAGGGASGQGWRARLARLSRCLGPSA